MENFESEIDGMVRVGFTHEEISQYLRIILPSQRGLSARSVRRFCAAIGIRFRSLLDTASLDCLIQSRVSLVGHSYGRRTLHGLLRSEGINVSQRRIGSSLQHVFPHAHTQRAGTMRRHINPVPYRASYFGEKLHFDQNEKVNMYGIVHVLPIDGFSRKLVGFISLPSKNPILIYDLLYRPILVQYGVWDQLRMDHGTEFNLVITVQQSISHYRNDQHRHPVLQSMSRQNHRAERIWPEINSRINYPIKRILVRMEGDGIIDMSNDITKFSTSWVTIRVISEPVRLFVNAWNAHTLPGSFGGIPNVLAQSSTHVGQIPYAQIPTTDDATINYESHGGRLSREVTYGSDPLAAYPGLQALRERDFTQVFSSMSDIFEDILHDDGDLPKQAILLFIDINMRYVMLISD